MLNDSQWHSTFHSQKAPCTQQILIPKALFLVCFGDMDAECYTCNISDLLG